ncbi:hypothetical protein [Catellatospora citrea]|nr:hypothetical protein [Catellatospora citrea]
MSERRQWRHLPASRRAAADRGERNLSAPPRADDERSEEQA